MSMQSDIALVLSYDILLMEVGWARRWHKALGSHSKQKKHDELNNARRHLRSSTDSGEGSSKPHSLTPKVSVCDESSLQLRALIVRVVFL